MPENEKEMAEINFDRMVKNIFVVFLSFWGNFATKDI
jgi:hypothetical protein